MTSGNDPAEPDPVTGHDPTSTDARTRPPRSGADRAARRNRPDAGEPPPPPGAEASATSTAPDGVDPGHTEWLPLLTHGDDQRFQADMDGPGPPPADPFEAGNPPRDGRPRTKRRAGRATRGEPPPPPQPEPLPDPASADPTTWLDPVAPPHPMEAAALAGAFAADYLSWDEQAPERRGQVLAQYLPSDVVGNAALLGWSGKGRQRAEFALPGAVRPDGEGRVVVDVRVRVTPYRAVGQPSAPAPAGDLEVAGVPAVAPAPTARGWKSLDSYWVRLTVPVNRDRGRLVVDTWDEQLGEDPEPPTDPVIAEELATAEDLEDAVATTGTNGTASGDDANGTTFSPRSPAGPNERPAAGPPPSGAGRAARPAEEPAATASPPASARPGRSGRTGERGRPGAPKAAARGAP